MNFDFSDDLKLLRDEARKVLARADTRALARAALEGRPAGDALWRQMAGMGWTGANVPASHGGAGMGPLAICVLAEELGYAVAPVPFSSSVCLATEALLRFGSPAQQERWLPRLAAGDSRGAFALAEGPTPIAPGRIAARVARGRLNGAKTPVADAVGADFLVVVAPDESGTMLHLVEPSGDDDACGIVRTAIDTLDRSRPHARVEATDARAEPLAAGPGWQPVRTLLDRAAVPMAFEQIGGAQAALEMARDYALQRHAFGRPIGSFQAIKHKLADVYVAIELARSNAYYAAWALDKESPELPAAAAAARIAASDAAWLACKENVQAHGGMGYTWELDCHLYYRRAKQQILALGGPREWKRRLADCISPRPGGAAPTRAGH